MLGAPQGNPSQIRTGANAWNTLAGQLDHVADDLHTHVTTLSSSWVGGASDAFVAEFEKLRTAVHVGTGDMRSLATTLNGLADEIEHAQRRYREILEGIGIAVVAGVALTFVTAGLSDVAAEAAVGAEVDATVEVAEGAAEAATYSLRALLMAARTLAIRFVVNFGINTGAQMAVQEYHHPGSNPLDHFSLKDGLIDAGVMTTFATFSPLLEGISGLDKIPILSRLAPAVRDQVVTSGAGAVVGATSNVIEDELEHKEVDPVEVLFAGIGGAGGEYISPKLVRLRNLGGETPPPDPAGGSVPDPTHRRVDLRNGTKKTITDAAPKTDGGVIKDPSTNLPIGPGDKIVFAHKPDFSWAKTQELAQQQGWTREQVIQYENDPSHYQIKIHHSDATP